ncbi:MAG: GAF domain-containing protein [Anaerolineales bacterium]
MMQVSNEYPFSVEALIPVCVGDLPGHSFTVSPDERLDVVVQKLERRPDLPGVMLIGRQVSVISRAKIFERLGHQYGVELYLHKPVSRLGEALKAEALLIPAQTRIEDAVRMALARPYHTVYDPVVVRDEELGDTRLVDMHVMLLAQSRLVANIADTVGKLEQLEKLIAAKTSTDEMLLSALELLSHVVPYHQAAVLMQKGNRMEYVARRGIGWGGANGAANQIQDSQIYRVMRETGQAVCLSDVNTVQDWECFGDMRNLRSWLGAPLIGDWNLTGILSLGRLTHSPFNKTEKDTAQVFASRMVQAMENKKSAAWQAYRGIESTFS